MATIDPLSQGAGTAIGAFATCASADTPLLAYAERGLNPLVHLYDASMMAEKAVIEGAADFDVACIAFSRDGGLMASVSSLPNRKLRLWDVARTDDEGRCAPALLVEHEVDFDPAFLSFNPLESLQLCASGGGSLCFFHLEKADVFYSVRAVPCKLDGDFLTASLRPHCHCWMPASIVYVGCVGGEALALHTYTGEAVKSASGAPAVIVTDDAAPITAVAATKHHVTFFTQVGAALWYTHAVDASTGSAAPGAASLVHEEALGMAEVRCVAFEQGCSAFLAGLADGSVVRVVNTPSDEAGAPPAVARSISKELDAHAGAIVRLEALPGGTHVVTAGADGTLRVWGVPAISGGILQLVGKRQFSSSQTCLAAAAHSPHAMACVGGETGVVRLLSCADPAVPVVVYRARLHASAAQAVALAKDGSHAASFGADGRLWLLRVGELSVEPLGFVALGEQATVSTLTFTADGALVGCVASTPHAPELFRLRVPLSAPQSEGLSLDPAAVGWQSFLTPYTLTSMVESPAGRILALAGDKTLVRYVLPVGAQAWGGPSGRVRAPDEATPQIAEKAGSHIALTANGEYATIGASDGSATIVPTGSLDQVAPSVVVDRLHSSHDGGSVGAALCAGGTLLSAGADGSIMAVTCQGSPDEKGLVQTAREAAAVATGSKPAVTAVASGEEEDMDEIDHEDEVTLGGGSSTAEVGHSPARTSACACADDEEAGEEESAEAPRRAALRHELQELRSLFQDMLRANETAGDLERLERGELVVDYEAREAMQKRGLERVEETRAMILEHDTRSEVVARRLVEACHAPMDVPTRVIAAFARGTTQPAVRELRSFGIGRRGRTEELARKVSFLRRVELRESAAMDGPSPRFLGSLKPPAPSEPASPTRPDAASPGREHEEEEEAAAGVSTEAARTGGSADAESDTAALLYGPYDLAPVTRKRAQALLLGIVLAEQRRVANESTEALARRKAVDIDRVAELHSRCAEIVAELGDGAQAEDWETPTLQPREHDDHALRVENSEITAERFASDEERAKAEREAAEEKARLASMSGDDPRERALKDMMGGSLQGRGDGDDSAEKARPEWMGGDRAKMSEEQLKELQAWDTREAAAAEEREKRSKALESELKKLHADVDEICAAFDAALQEAAITKAAADARAAACELRLLQLATAVERETEADENSEKALVAKIEKLAANRKKTVQAVAAYKREVDEVREVHEQMVVEDRAAERAFRRDFSDTGECLDALHKLYKRRGKVTRVSVDASGPAPIAGAGRKRMSVTGVASRRSVDGRRAVDGREAAAELMHRRVSQISEAEAAGAAALVLEKQRALASSDAFADALVSVKVSQMQHSDATFSSPLEEVFDRPEGCETVWWERLVETRHRKLENEAAIRTKQVALADKGRHLSRLQERDEAVRVELEKSTRELEALRAGRAQRARDLEIPLRVKQGQVETVGSQGLSSQVGPDADPDALLLDRTVVEDLNDVISTRHGAQKLDILSAIKDFKKGIYEMQWINKSLDMRTTDVVEKIREFQLMRVTRQLQEYVKSGEDTTNSQEVTVLESRLEHNRRLHDKKIDQKRRLLRRAAAGLRDKAEQNSHIRANVEDLERSVEDQARIKDESTTQVLPEEVASRRMRSLVTQRKLQDIGKAQAEEITLLRNELERLRLRTFPSFLGQTADIAQGNRPVS